MILLTTESGFLKPFAWVLGKIFNLIFEFIYMLDDKVFGNVNLPIIGICVILFTIIVRLIMLPLLVRQQKFSKLSSMMNPEIQAIQAKYKDKKDSESMMKMNTETKAVYEKYGTSPTGGCLTMLIQLPIMFALYRVIYKIPGYVTKIKGFCTEIYDALGKSGWEKISESVDKIKTGSTDKFIDSVYQLSSSEWKEVIENVSDPQAAEIISENSDKIIHMTNFFGISLMQAPGWKISLALIIPILAGVTQFISGKLSENKNNVQTNNDQNSMAGSMKAMNMIMPIMSVVFCITLPSCIGLYWIASSVVQIVIQLIINAKMNHVDVEQMVQKNIDKVNLKRAKKGLPPKKITNTATTYVEEVKKQEAREARQGERDEKIKQSTDYYKSSGKPGSLAAKANMVKMYNERNKKND